MQEKSHQYVQKMGFDKRRHRWEQSALTVPECRYLLRNAAFGRPRYRLILYWRMIHFLDRGEGYGTWMFFSVGRRWSLGWKGTVFALLAPWKYWVQIIFFFSRNTWGATKSATSPRVFWNLYWKNLYLGVVRWRPWRESVFAYLGKLRGNCFQYFMFYPEHLYCELRIAWKQWYMLIWCWTKFLSDKL